MKLDVYGPVGPRLLGRLPRPTEPEPPDPGPTGPWTHRTTQPRTWACLTSSLLCSGRADVSLMYVSFMQYVHLIGTHHVGHNVGHHVGHHVSHLVNLNFGHLAQALQYRIWDLPQESSIKAKPPCRPPCWPPRQPPSRSPHRPSSQPP